MRVMMTSSPPFLSKPLSGMKPYWNSAFSRVYLSQSFSKLIAAAMNPPEMMEHDIDAMRTNDWSFPMRRA